MSYPDATEDFPWGERALKVKGKVFLFMRGDRERISLSVKLPKTHFQALVLPFAKPTGYGLGKAGWVTAEFATTEGEMLEQVRDWLDESYRAVAPKTLVAALERGRAGAGEEGEAGRVKKRSGAARKSSPARKASRTASNAGKGSATSRPRGKSSERKRTND